MDCEVVVKMLSEGNKISPFCWSLVNRIRHLVRMNWEFRIYHLYHEANRCADVLVNLGCDLGDL